MESTLIIEESSARVEVVFFKSVDDALDAGVVGASDNRHLQIIHFEYFDDDVFFIVQGTTTSTIDFEYLDRP